MTMEIELAKQNGIQYRLTPEGTTEMWCNDRDVQAFAEAVRAAACAERDARIAGLERQLENEKQHSKHMTQDRDLWMLTASERGHQLEGARKDAKRYRWLRDGCDYKDTEATRIAKNEWGRDWDEAIDKAMQKYHP